MSIYSKARKSIFKPKNKKKWLNETKIQARSGLETKWMNYFDLNKNVISIASEKVIIPYFDPVKNKQRKYYTDLVVKFKDKNGDVKIKLIEIKNSKETVEPKKPKRMNNNYKMAVLTWITNQAKWSSAKIYAEERGWSFVILTERDLRK